MVVATLLWGGTFVVLRDILASITPAALVTTRFALAAAVFAAIALVRGRRPTRATLAGGLVAGLATTAGYLCQAIGLTATSAGSSAFLTSTGTLWAALLAWPLLGQRPGAWLAAGLVVAMAGSALLSLEGGLTLGTGEAWTLLGAAAFAFQVVALAHWAPRGDAVTLAGLQAAVAALCTLPAAGDVPAALARLDGADRARLAYLVACGSVLAPLLQVQAQRTLSAGRIGLLFALEPVFALAFALAVGGERFVARWWAGAALILGAVMLVEWREARRSAATPPRATA
jgi:drug/metabolite transporter (DMT)-like permease